MRASLLAFCFAGLITGALVLTMWPSLTGQVSQFLGLPRVEPFETLIFAAAGVVAAASVIFSLRLLAVLTVMFLAYGFRSWAKVNRRQYRGSALWPWISDQILAAQGRYAFALGCIAFVKSGNGSFDRVLLIKRPFLGFQNDVYLWPGARICGAEFDLSEEIRRIVRRETGCEVELWAAYTDPKTLRSTDGSGLPIENTLSAAPTIVMRQNREQRNGIPGHIDFLYIAEVVNTEKRRPNVLFVSLDSLNETSYPERELWPDTKEAILTAHKAVRGGALL